MDYEQNTLLGQKDKVFGLESELSISDEQLIQSESNFKQRITENNYKIKISKIQMQYEEVRSPREGIAFDGDKKRVLSGGNVIMKIIPQKKLKGSVTVEIKILGT